jgi:hypothetical protein
MVKNVLLTSHSTLGTPSATWVVNTLWAGSKLSRILLNLFTIQLTHQYKKGLLPFPGHVRFVGRKADEEPDSMKTQFLIA